LCRRRSIAGRVRFAAIHITVGGVQGFARFIHAAGVIERQLFAVCGGIRRRLGLATCFGFTRFQKRIAFNLFSDKFGELNIRQLQKLDRLLQLGRHHQGLALTHL